MNMIIKKTIIKKTLNHSKQHLSMFAALMLTAVMILLSAGCDADGGSVQNTIELPPMGDSELNFQCADEGIFEEKCVLDNPQNPYANVAVTEDNKFALNDAAPSAKARYYLWATALAKGAGAPGENQFRTALSLQQVLAQSGSPTTQKQAKKAYRSVLDNYFLSVTFFGPFTTDEGVEFVTPASLKDEVGKNLYNPISPDLVLLYDAQDLALADIGKWGYVYDTTNEIMSVFE